MLTAAVIPALGIGDALLMLIASHQLQLKNYQVITFHNHLPELGTWLPSHKLQTLPSDEELISSLTTYDLILVENDNSPRIKLLIDHYRPRLSIFYPTYKPTKHAPLSPLDRVFDPKLSMAENTSVAIATLLKSTPSKENGLTPPNTLIHRLKKNQVLIHPTSRVPTKNWRAEGFIKVAETLSSMGLTPLFCLAPNERGAWNHLGLPLADIPSLSHLAALIYESGFVIGNDSLPGHLASNLNIPTLIIADNENRMRLWRPDWLRGELVLPPPYLPNWKLLRRHWHSLITTHKVLTSFNKLKGSV